MLREPANVVDRDVFVVHAEDDTPFVKGELLPMLGLADDRVILSSELPFPAFTEQAIAASIERSRLTLAVVSPAYLQDRWAGFAELLSRNVHDDGRGGSLVPLLLADCDVPAVLAQHATLDCRTAPQRAASIARIRERLGRPEPAVEPIACPYPGMQPFTAAAASRFHGRAAEIEELVGRLHAGERELYVIGPSGSGKSSLIAAGLIPRLAAAGRFAVRTVRPGERPMQRLAEALACDPEGMDGAVARLLEREACDRLLVFVDQLEELFTQADAGERERFVRALGVLRADRRCYQIVALRADFYGALMSSALWPDFYGALMSSALWPDIDGRFTELKVAPLRREALREAIVAPARQVGVYLEHELVDRLIDDAAAEPGALPLLQEALVLLWERRSHRLLRLASYEALGEGGRSGLAVALARRADAVLHDLSLPQQRLAQRIFLRLVSFGEDRPDTRRQQPRAALAASGDEAADVDAVLDRLIAARMLTSDATAAGEPLVDLAHEVLIAGWPELQRWLLARRDDEQCRRLLELHAAEWAKRGRGSVGLFDVVELGEAERWIAGDTAREVGYSDGLRQFLTASRAAIDEAELVEQRAQDERLRLRRQLVRFVIGALTVFSITASVLGLIAWRERNATRLQLGLNEQERARSLLLESHDASDAIPHLLQAVKFGIDSASLRTLLAEARHGMWRFAVRHGGPVWTAAFSPDGSRVVTASSDGTARIWDAATGAAIAAPLEHAAAVVSAAFSPDGSRIVTASEDGTARVWDAATGAAITVPLKHDRSIIGLVLPYSSLSVWDDTDATIDLTDLPSKRDGAVTSAVFSPDGSRIVTAGTDGTARVWDAARGVAIAAPIEHGGWVNSAAFSFDGSRIITVSTDGAARIWGVLETGALSIWVEQAHRCVLPEADAIGASALCPLQDHKTTPSDVLANARSIMFAGDAAAFSRVWFLSKADYQRAIDLLDRNHDIIVHTDTADAEYLRKVLSIRIAVLDAIVGHLDDARTHLGTDAPAADADLLGLLGQFAHNELCNDVIAISLLLHAQDRALQQVDILTDLAEAYFASGRYDDFARTAAQIDRRSTTPDERVAMAALAWAAARLTHTADDTQRAHLMEAVRQVANGTVIQWTWTGTKHALRYGHVRYEAAKPILDVLDLLEQPVTDETREKLARLLRTHGDEQR